MRVGGRRARFVRFPPQRALTPVNDTAGESGRGRALVIIRRPHPKSDPRLDEGDCWLRGSRAIASATKDPGEPRNRPKYPMGLASISSERRRARSAGEPGMSPLDDLGRLGERVPVLLGERVDQPHVEAEHQRGRPLRPRRRRRERDRVGRRRATPGAGAPDFGGVGLPSARAAPPRARGPGSGRPCLAKWATGNSYGAADRAPRFRIEPAEREPAPGWASNATIRQSVDDRRARRSKRPGRERWLPFPEPPESGKLGSVAPSGSTAPLV